MSTLAILPVKNLSQSKSRLSHEVNRQQRELLTFHLLRRTLGVLKLAKGIDDILMVSRDIRVRSIAEMENVLFLQEQGTDLNQALEQATRWSGEQNYSAILILPLDLPFLTREDIDTIIIMGNEKREIVIIAPDREMKGTNALLVKPPGILQYQFGSESFHCHWQQTLDRHIESRIYHSTNISFDVDFPDQYQSMLQGNRTEFNLCRRR